MGPALFSTPDIIRRVGSNSDGKIVENTSTSTISATPTATTVSTPGLSTASILTTNSLNISTSATSDTVLNTVSNLCSAKVSDTLEQPIQPELQINSDESNNVMLENENEEKSEMKAPSAEELQPSLDTGKIKYYVKKVYIIHIMSPIMCYLFTNDFYKAIACFYLDLQLFYLFISSIFPYRKKQYIFNNSLLIFLFSNLF